LYFIPSESPHLLSFEAPSITALSSKYCGKYSQEAFCVEEITAVNTARLARCKIK